MLLRRRFAIAPPLRLGRSAAWTGRRGVVTAGMLRSPLAKLR